MKLEKVIKNNWCFNKIEELAKEAFPPEEYLSPYKILEMASKDNFDFYAIVDDQEFIGFTVIQTYKDLCYLFFLAIAKEHRANGYGSKTLNLIKARYPDKKQVVDFEMLDKNADNYEQRYKRRCFYLNNGYKETGLFLSYLGVNYEVFSMSDGFNENTFKELMKEINVDGFNPKYFKKW